MLYMTFFDKGGNRRGALFDEEIAARKVRGEEAGSLFDCAFRFLEETFGDSQELVLFVTEITAGYDTSWFVEVFGCAAYFRHNRELLFDDTRRRIREELAAVGRGGTPETENGGEA